MTNAALRGRPDKAALRTTQTGNRLAKAIGVVAALLCFSTATALADSINLSEVMENKTVADGTTLTIKGDGSLDASSNGYGAGIGGGNKGTIARVRACLAF